MSDVRITGRLYGDPDEQGRRAWRGANGIKVTYRGSTCKVLAVASRMVFVHEGYGVVVKVQALFSHTANAQCLQEFVTYHEVLDDEARACAVEVLDYGQTTDDGGQRVEYNTQTYVEAIRADAMPEWAPPGMHKHANRCRNILTNRYGLSDLHSENYGFTQDGRFVVWDLGISDGVGLGKPISSPAVLDLIERIPSVRSSRCLAAPQP
jgi:hypothetical protein